MQGAIRQTTRKPSKVCIKNVPFAALLARLHLGLAVSDRRLKVNCSAVMVVFSECLQRDSKFWLKCLKSKIKCNSEDYKLHQEDCFGLEEGVQQQGSSGVGRVHLHLAETPDALIVTKTQTESGQDAEKCLFLHFGGNSLDKSIEYFFPLSFLWFLLSTDDASFCQRFCFPFWVQKEEASAPNGRTRPLRDRQLIPNEQPHLHREPGSSGTAHRRRWQDTALVPVVRIAVGTLVFSKLLALGDC